jgi:hypothetical protein
VYASLSIDPQTQVSGDFMLALVECTKKDKIAAILAMTQLNAIDSDRWYPAKLLAEILTEISLARGGALDLTSIGMKVPDTIIMPSEIQGIGEALRRWNEVYRQNFRFGDVGWYEVSSLNANHMRVTDYTPWPRDLSFGMLQGLARRYVRANERFEIHNDLLRPVTNIPADQNAFHVTWRIQTGLLELPPNR